MGKFSYTPTVAYGGNNGRSALLGSNGLYYSVGNATTATWPASRPERLEPRRHRDDRTMVSVVVLGVGNGHPGQQFGRVNPLISSSLAAHPRPTSRARTTTTAA